MSCSSSLSSKQRTCRARSIGRDLLSSPAPREAKTNQVIGCPCVYLEAPPTNSALIPSVRQKLSSSTCLHPERTQRNHLRNFILNLLTPLRTTLAIFFFFFGPANSRSPDLPLQPTATDLRADPDGVSPSRDHPHPSAHADPELPAHQAEPLQQPNHHAVQLAEVRGRVCLWLLEFRWHL